MPVVMVTGCGSGIGLAIADLLYRHEEYRVVITARKTSLEFLRSRFAESERFWILPLDVTDGGERDQVVGAIHERWGSVNVLINNAGIAYRAVVEHMTEEDERKQIATNYLGPMGLIRLVLPVMRERGRGKIINVSSVSGMLAMPTMASYSASKHALEGASEALWYETRPLGISVSLIQPGFVNSSSFKRVYYSKQSRAERDAITYRDYYEYMSPFIDRLMRLTPSTPESIARLTLKVIKTENPPLYIPATIDAKLFYYLRRVLPRRWFLPLLSWLLPGSRRWGEAYTNRRRAKTFADTMRSLRWRYLNQGPDRRRKSGEE